MGGTHHTQDLQILTIYLYLDQIKIYENYIALFRYIFCTILNNALPSNLKTVKNVDIFKKKYSEYLLLQQEHD